MTENQKTASGALTKRTLLKRLRELGEHYDLEMVRHEADRLLLQYINDPKIAETYHAALEWRPGRIQGP